MSAVSTIAKNTFNKIFKNLAKEHNTEPGKIQLGIFYDGGQNKFEFYNEMKRVGEFDIDDYVGAVIDWSGGSEVIKSTIAQAGANYSKELSVSINEIKIIMAYRENLMPQAVLMISGVKKRSIDIETEFLN